MEEWRIAGIAVALCASFALLLSSAIARSKGRSGSLSFWCGILAWFFADLLAVENKPAYEWTVVAPFVLLPGPELVACFISKRRLSPPHVRVKRVGKGVMGIVFYVIGALALVFFCYLAVTGIFPRVGGLVTLGLLTVLFIVVFASERYSKPELCGNGFWKGLGSTPGLQPWEEFRSFSWTGETELGIELRLEPRREDNEAIQLMALLEDREVVRRLLEAHLPEAPLA
jgi:hypothetical protein